MRPLATADDLAGTTPGQVAWLTADQLAAVEELGADRMLLRASEVIAEHVSLGYFLDDNGDPAVPEVRDALRDACCAQVEQWLEVGEENDVAGYARTAAMSSSGMSLSSLPSILAPRARRILRLSGLNGAVAY